MKLMKISSLSSRVLLLQKTIICSGKHCKIPMSKFIGKGFHFAWFFHTGLGFHSYTPAQLLYYLISHHLCNNCASLFSLVCTLVNNSSVWGESVCMDIVVCRRLSDLYLSTMKLIDPDILVYYKNKNKLNSPLHFENREHLPSSTTPPVL